MQHTSSMESEWRTSRLEDRTPVSRPRWSFNFLPLPPPLLQRSFLKGSNIKRLSCRCTASSASFLASQRRGTAYWWLCNGEEGRGTGHEAFMKECAPLATGVLVGAMGFVCSICDAVNDWKITTTISHGSLKARPPNTVDNMIKSMYVTIDSPAGLSTKEMGRRWTKKMTGENNAAEWTRYSWHYQF